MPYVLRSTSKTSRVNLSSPITNIGDVVGDYIEYCGTISDFSAGNGLWGETAGTVNLLNIQSTTNINFRIEDDRFNYAYTAPANGTKITLRVTKESATEWRCNLNGTDLGLGGGSSTSSTKVGQVLSFINSDTSGTVGDFEYIKIQKNGVVTNLLDADSSGGTGSTLTASVGSVTGTLINFPVDDSQWVLVGGSETLDVTEASATHGDTLNATSSITDGISAKIIDASANELALTSFNNAGGGNYTFVIPALSEGLVGVIPGACTIEITNGTATATDTITLAAPSGYTEVTATAQTTLTEDDWGYVGVGGLDNAATAGDIGWFQTTAGLTFNANGSITYDYDIFTGGTVTFWLQDSDDTRTWTKVVATYDGAAASARRSMMKLSSIKLGF